jgi:hypothetical protein
MPEERLCLMTIVDGRADNQSLSQLNQCLNDGWRISGINHSLQRLPGVGNMKAFFVELTKHSKTPK